MSYSSLYNVTSDQSIISSSASFHSARSAMGPFCRFKILFWFWNLLNLLRFLCHSLELSMWLEFLISLLKYSSAYCIVLSLYAVLLHWLISAAILLKITGPALGLEALYLIPYYSLVWNAYQMSSMLFDSIKFAKSSLEHFTR